jgi:hypothetical protein
MRTNPRDGASGMACGSACADGREGRSPDVKIFGSDDRRAPPAAVEKKMDFHFRRLGLSGATLVVVTVGAEVYGACDLEPLAALHAVARRASEDLARRAQPIDPTVIIERGRARWTREGRSAEAEEARHPATPPRRAA